MILLKSCKGLLRLPVGEGVFQMITFDRSGGGGSTVGSHLIAASERRGRGGGGDTPHHIKKYPVWNNTINWRYFKVFQRYFYRHQNRSSTILYPPQKFEVHFLPLKFFSNTKKHRWIFFQVQKTPVNIFSSTKNTVQYFLRYNKNYPIFLKYKKAPLKVLIQNLPLKKMLNTKFII